MVCGWLRYLALAWPVMSRPVTPVPERKQHPSVVAVDEWFGPPADRPAGVDDLVVVEAQALEVVGQAGPAAGSVPGNGIAEVGFQRSDINAATSEVIASRSHNAGSVR